MRLRLLDADGLQRVPLIEGIADASRLRAPVAGLVGKLGRRRCGRGYCLAHRRRCWPARRCRPGSSANPGRDRRGKRGTGWNALADPCQKSRGVWRQAGRFREHRRVIGGDAVNDGEPRVDGGAMTGVDAPLDRGREDDTSLFLQAGEGRRPCRIVGREIGAGDGDEAPAGCEACEGRRDMAEGCAAHRAVDMGHCREGRVHQHEAWPDIVGEMVMDLRGIEGGDGAVGEKRGQQGGARVGKLIEDERRAGEFGEGGEKPRTGRRLQHAVRSDDARRHGGDEAERKRRRELLHGLALLGAARVGRQQPHELLQHGEALDRIGSARPHRVAELAQEQELGRLAGIVGVLPLPDALRVAAAEGVLHCSAEDRGVDGLAPCEMWKKKIRSPVQRRCPVGR